MDEVMDPNGSAFQDMLAAAQSKGEAALSIKPDTSTTESQTEAKAPESSSEGKVDEKVEEALSDDVDALKNTIRGMKAEMSRVRNLKSASENEAGSLKERLANLEGRLTELKEAQPSGKSAQDSIKKLSEEKLIELHTSYDDELADARTVARMAERDGDREGIAHANQRIDNARKMLNLLKGEENVRMRESSRSARDADDESTRLGGELESLFTDVFKAAPELSDHDSDLWKAGQEEYRKLPTLTKKMGPIGELIATAAAIAKNPGLIGKKSSEKAVEKMLDNIEAVADKSFNRGGTAPQAGKVASYNLKSTEDVMSFEEEVNRIKRG
jgi:chromosome segregation ATPase